MITGLVMAGKSLAKVIVCTPAPGMLKLIVSVPAFPFALRIAWRSDPAPESFVFITVKVMALVTGIPSATLKIKIRGPFIPAFSDPMCKTDVNDRILALEGVCLSSVLLASRRSAFAGLLRQEEPSGESPRSELRSAAFEASKEVVWFFIKVRIGPLLENAQSRANHANFFVCVTGILLLVRSRFRIVALITVKDAGAGDPDSLNKS